MEDVLANAYPFLDHLDLEKAAPAQVSDAFAATGASPSIVKRAMSFFINASSEAGRIIGPRLRYGRRVAVAASATRTSRRPVNKRAGAYELKVAQTALARQLLEKLPPFDPKWAPQVQASWMRCFHASLKRISGP
ncbi:MAG: hypothetical protein J7493_14755 [Porphyrobacter sp.]|nr:hypothetical protein [Porphyrobacter sp.]